MTKADHAKALLPKARDYDVVILGAGPTGAVAAHCLAKSGRDVLLLDRAFFPRLKVCGGCLNRHALAGLSAAGLGDIPSRLGAMPLKEIKLNTAKRGVTIPLLGGQAISRAALDQALVQAAQNSGAQFSEGVTGHPVRQTDEGWTIAVKTKNDQGEIKARALLVATGLGTKPMTGFSIQGEHKYSSSQNIWQHSRLGGGTILKDASLNLETNRIHMALASGGYVGMVHLEHNLVAIAAALDGELVKSQKGLANAAAHILKTTKQDIPPTLFEAVWRGTPLLTRKLNPIAGTRFLVAGDAAGYVEPFTGEGMAWAISSGLKAATLIHRGIDQWSPHITPDWKKWHNQHVMRSQLRCKMLASALRKNWMVEASMAGFGFMPFLAKPFINALDSPAKEYF